MEPAGTVVLFNLAGAFIVKKSPPTPDVNAKAPRPKHVSPDDPPVPTMDTPPEAPAETDADSATGFDRATDAANQEYRSGLLPGSDDIEPNDAALQDDDDDVDEDDMDGDPDALEETEAPDRDADAAEGVDPVKYAEFWDERESFPQQDDPDLEAPLEERATRPGEEALSDPEMDELSDPDAGQVSDQVSDPD